MTDLTWTAAASRAIASGDPERMIALAEAYEREASRSSAIMPAARLNKTARAWRRDDAAILRRYAEGVRT